MTFLMTMTMTSLSFRISIFAVLIYYECFSDAPFDNFFLVYINDSNLLRSGPILER